MKNVVVAGCKGMLGGMLLRKLAEKIPQAQVRALDLPELDITDPKNCAAEKFAGADTVFNCAAYTAVDKAESEADKARLVNVAGVANLARACAEAGAKLVHLSTDFVFGAGFNSPIKTDAAPAPMSVYGVTKLDGERAALANCPNALIVRTAWLYGPGGKNFVDTILAKAKEGAKLRIVADQQGAPTYTADLAAALIGLALAKACGVYHCTNSGETTWHGFACEFLRLAGFKDMPEGIPTSAYPTPAKRPPYSVLDLSKTEAALGRPLRRWDEALREFLRESGRLNPAT